MPFKSEAQRKLCYLLKNKGQAGSWDCSEWSAETGKKKLPEHVKKQEEKKALEAVAKLARCWAGYEPVPGKEPFSNDSCRPKAKSKKQEEKKGSNILVGGKGDNKKPSDFPKDVIDEAVNHETEHTSNKDVAKEIAVDHLTEDVDYYKKLKKIEGNKEAAMHKLAKAWAAKAKISKLAEVATVPNRGAGDKQDTVIDTDPTEGLPKTNEIESASLPDKKPVNKRLRSAQARKALISATRKTFGINPTGGSLFSKMSADFDFSGLNKKLDPSILGSSNNASFSNPINQLGNTLKQVGSEMGNRVGGAVRQGVEGWVKAPGFSNPMEVYRRRNQALAAQKAFGDMGKGVGQAFSNAQHGMASMANQMAPAAANAGRSLVNIFNKVGADSTTYSADALADMSHQGKNNVLGKPTKWKPSISTGLPEGGGYSFSNNVFTDNMTGKKYDRYGMPFGGTYNAEGTRWIAGDAGSYLPANGSNSAAPAQQAPAPQQQAPAPQASNKPSQSPAASNQAQASGNNYIKTPTISPGAIMSGAGSALGNAFSAGFNNDAAYQALQQQANFPDMVKTYESAKDAYNQAGNAFSNIYQTAKNMMPTAISGATNLPYIKDIPIPYKTPETKLLGFPVPSVNMNIPLGTAGNYVASRVKNYLDAPSAPGPGAVSNAANSMFNKLPESAQNTLRGVGAGFSNVANTAAQNATNYFAQQEAARRTAGYALPVVDFFRNNPWAAYALTAGGGLLGGALLGRMFGRGEDDQQQKEDNPVESAMAQGYKQQASRQMPANAYDPRSRYA